MSHKTGKSAAARQHDARLTRREREIMNAVFALNNRASAEDIRTRMTSPPSYSSVRVMLARLEKKGYVKHEGEGLKYMYSATISPAVAKRSALQEYLKTFFGGSMRQMVSALVREESWTEEELATLQSDIEKARTERRRS
jgi:predicted transcriptional regulator